MLSSSLIHRLNSRLSLPILHHVSGIAEGLHVAFGAGQSQDFLDLVPYAIGDDVSTIDWKSSARTGQPIIKRFERHTLATMLLVVDCGRPMSALASPWTEGECNDNHPATTKDKIAIELIELFSYLALLRGDKVGLIAGHREKITTHLARHGKQHIHRMRADVQRLMSPQGPPSDLSSLLHRTRIVATTPSIVLVFTDGQPPSRAVIDELKKLKHRHWVGVATILDANPALVQRMDSSLEITPDVNHGNTPFSFFSYDSRLINQIAARQQQSIQQMLAAYRSAGIHHIPLATRSGVPKLLERSFGKGRTHQNKAGGQ